MSKKINGPVVDKPRTTGQDAIKYTTTNYYDTLNTINTNTTESVAKTTEETTNVHSVSNEQSVLECNQLLKTENSGLVVLPAQVQNRDIQVLVDCGSTGNFISESFVYNNRIPTCESENKCIVTLADGSRQMTNRIVRDVYIEIKESKSNRIYRERVNLNVLPLQTYQVILGMPWLKYHNPMIDWSGRRLVIKNNKNEIFTLETEPKHKQTKQQKNKQDVSCHAVDVTMHANNVTESVDVRTCTENSKNEKCLVYNQVDLLSAKQMARE